MFGTLIIGLPAGHTGGELFVRFDGREEMIDFAPAANNFAIAHAAFFADCEHEVKPVTSGYRVCLAYNLLQSSGGKKIESLQFSTQVEQLSDAVGEEDGVPLIVGAQLRPALAQRCELCGHIARGEPHPVAAPFTLERFTTGRLIDEAAAAAVSH